MDTFILFFGPLISVAILAVGVVVIRWYFLSGS